MHKPSPQARQCCLCFGLEALLSFVYLKLLRTASPGPTAMSRSASQAILEGSTHSRNFLAAATSDELQLPNPSKALAILERAQKRERKKVVP